mgnify:CR=1 FL=1
MTMPNRKLVIQHSIHHKIMGGNDMEKRIEQLKADRQQLNMRLAEINFLINGYETTIKAEKEKPKEEKDEQTAD